ncbi:MAG: translational GTPase TypA [Candidatus Eremiobacteraeota bacterium]|nr:translational GTPase TypA [Candidatus Eremiobacteraeota bacterium]
MIRNIAIIAHVDHGKTTLIDGFLKQSKTFRYNEAAMFQTLILDSNDQERERGITILAKNTAVNYGDIKINIIDTPGHADFSGEVERTLNMADGAILVIDAQEGPMPQTRFVLQKALELGLKLIVVINKIDKQYARIDEVTEEIYDLFLELVTENSHLDFPIYYAIGRDGKAWENIPEDISKEADLTPLFDGIIKNVPAPEINVDSPLLMQVSAIDWDSYQGKYVIGKIKRGFVTPGLEVSILNNKGNWENGKITKVYTTRGLKRTEVNKACSGDIVIITGLKNACIGDTIADVEFPEALPRISIEEPTLKMAILPNTSPFAGKEGQFCTGRQILERIYRELESNVALQLEIDENNEYVVSGRGELHLSVFVENMRREGYEFSVGKPHVITKKIDGVLHEPIEELTIDVNTEFANTVIGLIGRRRGIMTSQVENNNGTSRLLFEIPTRGILGLKNQLMTLSRGTAVMNSLFIRYGPAGYAIPRLRKGVLVASETGKAFAYGLNIAQGRGTTFIHPGTMVYSGMIIGLNCKNEDIIINVSKEKKATNVRSSGTDDAILLAPPTILSLERAIDFLDDDELLEVTPKSLRLRKKILDKSTRLRTEKNAEKLKNIKRCA